MFFLLPLAVALATSPSDPRSERERQGYLKRYHTELSAVVDRADPIAPYVHTVVLAWAAWNAGLVEDSRRLAQEALADPHRRGFGEKLHIILGHAWLTEGNVKAAVDELQMAQQVLDGDVGNTSFGVDVSLAVRLYLKGEHGPALAFLHEAMRLQPKHERLAQCVSQLVAGRPPSWLTPARVWNVPLWINDTTPGPSDDEVSGAANGHVDQ